MTAIPRPIMLNGMMMMISKPSRFTYTNMQKCDATAEYLSSMGYVCQKSKIKKVDAEKKENIEWIYILDVFPSEEEAGN
jgi:hypothetical protein